MSSVSEAGRFLSLLQCLPRLSRQLVRQTPEYPQGQLKVLPLLVAVLPGIDWNDFEKTTATLDFLETILSLISCVDCSSAATERTDLTEIEKEVCRSTSMFGEFVAKFFDRIFGLIEILSGESSEALPVSESPTDSETVQMKVKSIVAHLVEQCSDDILQVSIDGDYLSSLSNIVFRSFERRSRSSSLVRCSRRQRDCWFSLWFGRWFFLIRARR